MRPTVRRLARVSRALLLPLLLAASAQASVQLELAFHRGVVAYGEGRYDDAQAQFEKVLAEDPEDTTALQYLGLIAQKREDYGAAVGFYDRALAIDPEDTEIQLDRGVALIDARRVPEAREALAAVLAAEPDNARAHLFAGIAAYRMNAYAEATAHFDRAAELDPSLRDESRYYTGLSQALAGNAEAATAAFGEVEEVSPMSPLAQSAQNLRAELESVPREERRWFASFTAGLEWDDNPLVAGTATGGVPVDSGDDDGRAVFRPRGWFRFLSGDNYSVTGGYDGYLGVQFNEQEVDLQVHNPWIAGGYDIGPFRLGLRTDYSYTMNDLTEEFRHLIRTTPTVSYRAREWSLSQAFYQFTWKDYLDDLTSGTVLDRDGWRHLFGVNQFFFLPEPYTYVRIGAHGDFNRSEGTEWDYDGMEANFGCGYDFPYDISLGWLFRFLYRSYDNGSLFSTPVPFFQAREDYRYMLTAELAKSFAGHWVASVGGAFTWNQSNVNFYDYSRHIVGAYLTYSF